MTIQRHSALFIRFSLASVFEEQTGMYLVHEQLLLPLLCITLATWNLNKKSLVDEDIVYYSIQYGVRLLEEMRYVAIDYKVENFFKIDSYIGTVNIILFFGISSKHVYYIYFFVYIIINMILHTRIYCGVLAHIHFTQVFSYLNPQTFNRVFI